MAQTKDDLCGFVLEHYEDLDAAAKVFDLGKERLREWVKREVYEALEEEGFLKKSRFEVQKDESEIWWYLSEGDKLWWDSEKETGIYFALEINSKYSESMVEPTKDEIYLSLYHTDGSAFEKGKLAKLRSHISRESSRIKREGFHIRNEYGYLVGYEPSRELSLTAIRDNSQFPAAIVKKVIQFTEMLLPIVQNFKDK